MRYLFRDMVAYNVHGSSPYMHVNLVLTRLCLICCSGVCHLLPGVMLSADEVALDGGGQHLVAARVFQGCLHETQAAQSPICWWREW